MTEVIKADECDWVADFQERKKEPGQGQGDRKKMDWMKFDKPGSYTVRLVGKSVKFLKYYKPYGKGTRIITHKNYRDEDPAWQAGFYPNDTFAVHIIDRADGKIKILEKGRGLFKSFAEYQQVNDISPAGNEAPDFVIKVEWPNGEKNNAKYSATAKQKILPLTDEEKKLIQDTFTEGDIKAAKEAGVNPLLFRLKRIYQTTDLAKIKEAWNNLPDAAKIPPKKGEKGEKEEVAAETAEVVETPVIKEPTAPTADASEKGDGLWDDEPDTTKSEDTPF